MSAESRSINPSQEALSHLPLAYPFDWKDADDFSYPLDEDGIPLVQITKKSGLRYNPITVAQYGLFHLQRYSQIGEKEYLDRAERAVHWLVKNFREWRGEIGAWVYDYDLDFYGPKAPWISGMAQGEGISLLLRAHQIFPEKTLLEISKRAYNAFLHPVADGGVVSAFPDGALVFEEFPTEPPSLVLNGHIFALLGIYDYAAFWEDSSARDLFDIATSGLKRNLERYDTGYWNLYDLHPTQRLASPMYVRIHVQLLNILADLANDADFRKVGEKWRAYLTNPVCRLRWLGCKIIEKIRLKF